MIITIENTRTQKQTQIEIADELYTEASDLLFRIEMDQYKLVSTKSEEDKKREALAIEFGETYYSELYEKFPDFGEEGCLLTKDACKEIIEAKLVGKFEELRNDKNPELLLNGLVTAFGNYCQVKKQMDAKDAEIRNSRKHENVFFDYILRLEEVFNTANTVKDIVDGIAKQHEYASLDERQIYGYAIIFEQLKPFFNWSADTDKELREIKPYKPITEQTFYTDKDYFINHIKLIANEVKENLLKLKHDHDIWINSKMQSQHVVGEHAVFTEYLNILRDNYQIISNYYETLKAAGTPTEDKPVDVEKLEKAKEEFREHYKSFIRNMIDLRINIELDPRGFTCAEEKDFFLSHCGFVDFWYNQVVSQKEKDAGDKFMHAVEQHIPCFNAILSKRVDVVKLLHNGYSKEELNELINKSSSTD